MSQPASRLQPQRAVPVHSLGISQILAYGMLFYGFAQLKQPLAIQFQLSELYILTALSLTVGAQACLAPVFGYIADKYSALSVMCFGFFAGGAGLGVLAIGDSVWFLLTSYSLIGLGMGCATYELAFSSAVQLDEKHARMNISYITFYGAVASSITWLVTGPLLAQFGLEHTLWLMMGVLWLAGARMGILARIYTPAHRQATPSFARFSWSELRKSEKRAMGLLAFAGGCEYLAFSAAAMMWISWFDNLYQDLAIAVVLASIYGPFQLCGRVAEMYIGRRFDARLTGAVAASLVPLAMIFAYIDNIYMSALAMALFGMGHGVLTVTLGFVTNLYFRAEIYGRAKGWISLPRSLGLAMGPLAGGFIFAQFGQMFLLIVTGCFLLACLSIWALLFQPPTNQIHITEQEGR
jgi:MFS family permease